MKICTRKTVCFYYLSMYVWFVAILRNKMVVATETSQQHVCRLSQVLFDR